MIDMKTVIKFTGAACAAVGIAALSGLVASGAAAGAVAEGFRSAADTVKKVFSDDTEKEDEAAESENSGEETAGCQA